MKNIVPAATAIGAGIIVLLGYLLTDPILLTVRLALVDWVVVVAGLAILIGIINLTLVHARRIDDGDQGWVYSFFTILALLFTLVVGIYESYGAETPALYQEQSVTHILYEGIMVASLATLSSLVMFFLIVAAVRLLKTKPGGWSILFLGSVVLMLIGWIPVIALEPLNNFWQWMISVPAAAGARGVIIGVALGTLVIGLRVLTGAERPYRE